MTFLDRYKHWKLDDLFDIDIKKELDLITDLVELEDRFYKDLEFGTGGLRGIMGAGTNRVNKYTIGKATQGLANYLKDSFTETDCLTRGIVVAYDTRNNSREFANVTSDIMSANGIKVHLFDLPVPTPELSFAVRHYNAIAGIVITASHNPKEYNGYKVYDEYGSQLVPHQAKDVIKYVNNVEDYKTINFDRRDELICYCNVTDFFVAEILKQSLYENNKSKSNLKIVYTPLHGTGNIPVRKVLVKSGFSNINIVSSQEIPDGNFSTVSSPNPEEKKALSLGIELAKKVDADIVLGTDPDCDRVGVGVKVNNEYKLLTGNQIGALLTDYIVKNTDVNTMKNPAIIKTVVTNELGADIAKKYGCKVFNTLTGFKFIGEKMTQFEKNKDYTFLLGYEESYGYLVGNHARDKDAVVACMLICEMASKYKEEGMTLFDKLNDIYKEYGYFKDALDSFTLKGKDGSEQISNMMKLLREGSSPFEETKNIIDYSQPVSAEEGYGLLPTSNVLKYILNDDSWVAVRPSGTEPKIKIYYSIKGTNESIANQRFNSIQDKILTKLGLGGK